MDNDCYNTKRQNGGITVRNGSVIVYDETGKEYNMRIEDILQKDIEQVRHDAERAAPLFYFLARAVI